MGAYASDTLAQHPCSMRAPRHCAPLPAALPEPQSSQISRNACAQPAAQSPGDAPRHLRHVCVLVCMGLGASWAHIRIQDPVPQPDILHT